MPRPLKEEKLLTEESAAPEISPSSCLPEEVVEEVVAEEVEESPPTTEEVTEPESSVEESATDATAVEPREQYTLPLEDLPPPVTGAVQQSTEPEDESEDEEEIAVKRYFSKFTQGVSIHGQFTKFRQGHEFTDPGLIAYLKEHQFPLTEE